MWPLTGREIREAIGVREACDADDERFFGVTTVDRPAYADEVFFALNVDRRDAHGAVPAFLRGPRNLAVVDASYVPRAAIAPRCLRVPDVLAAFGALASAMRARFAFPVIAIGGANGKTTAKEMTRAVLSGGAYRVTASPGTENGHYGVPLTLLQRDHVASRPPHACVVEIGIDAIGTMRAHAARVKPDLVVLTALGAEHLRGLKDEATAAREERELFEASPHARRVFDASEPELRRYVEGRREGDVIAGDAAQAGANLRYEIGKFDGSGRELTWTFEGARGGLRVPMPGVHHARLAALAVGVALAMGRTPDEIADGWKQLHAPASRAHVTSLARGFTLIDDSFNANPSSMRAALELLREEVWAARPKGLVLGDMLDLGDATASAHRELASLIASLEGVHVRLYGDAMRETYEALSASRRLASLAHRPSSFDPVKLLDAPFAALEGGVCLVKASHGMHLGRVCTALQRAHAKPRVIPARPSFAADFTTVGVTGTNGKSTTTTWIAACLARQHRPIARATTTGYYVDDEKLDYPFDFDGFTRALKTAHARGARVCALEVTSEALRNGFAKLWPFRVGVFTNLSHDHLDVHGSHEHYLASKAQLFMHLAADGAAVLNAADPTCALLREVVPPGVTVYRYAVASRGAYEGDVDLVAIDTIVDGARTRARLARSARVAAFPEEITICAVGDVYVENALAAALGAFAAGISPHEIAIALAHAPPPPGRFEILAQHPHVVIDYAHTPDALARTLDAARAFTRGRVLLVFGAGGDRDREKRVPMGQAARAADHVIVTNDNPRSEDPSRIADDLRRGLGDRAGVEVILDRAKAIATAVTMASGDDVVLICGKGHETEQQMGGAAHPFSDRDVALAHCK